MKQYQKLLLGFVVGVVLGLIGYYSFPEKAYPFMKHFTDVCTLTGAVFLRMIFMVVVPMITSALILGVYDLGKCRSLGKVASRSAIFTVILSLLSVLVAITLVNVMQPGVGLEFDREALLKNQGIVSINKNVQLAQDKPWFQYIIELIPQNPVDSAARSFGGEIMALMVFSLMFGYAMSQAISEEDNPLVKCMEAIFTTTQRIILWAMQIAPYGIFAIVFNTTYRMGAGFLQNLAYFAGVVILGLLFQQFVVYSICLKVFARINPFEFFRQCREVYVYAFSTASSNATLPITLEVAEKTLKLPPEIARFVLTCGASANQNGTALFEGVAVLFLAQAFGIDLSLQQQIVVVFMSVMAGIGAAGIPGGSLPMIAIILINVGIPVEGLGLILGIDRFLDMCRTALNVSGDLVIAKLVSATAAEKCDATTSLHN